MELHPFMARAATETATLVRAIRPDQLDAATPCREYDVRALANHLLWVLLLAERAAAKLPAPDDDSLDENRDRIGEGWTETLAKQAETVGAAWAEPSAWEGKAHFGSGEIPAAFAASLVFADLVVHGWDLARATGQPFHCDDEVAEATYRLIAQLAEQGRTMGAFGAEVPVAETASPLDRALGLSGRDPNWTATR